ncbi:glycosyltransferase family 4 protein [Mesorhizobium sp.]|uniref:glycosyltransferase family 4 protein n=1 Tax=Mesorhizobium sp. TaxID=1871066 RepID=UPI0012098882|nr:glycosyltransferase family 4 protein [Mesorhizobium sp.]TIL40494.1 MAG: glycosyltransferase family 4 protein [Mesorhizobium sp.]
MTIYLIQKRIAEYRIGVFNAIARRRKDLIVCSQEPPKSQTNFKWMHLQFDKKKFGQHAWNIPFDAENDILITGLDLRNPSLLSIIFSSRGQVVVWSHGFGRRWGSFFMRPLRLIAAARVTASIFYTESGRDQFARWVANDKLFVARNTIALACFEADPTVCRDSYLYFGDYRDEKGLMELLDAFAIVAAEHPSLRLVLVGSGPIEASMKTKANRGGFSDRIEFHPRTSTPEALKKFLDRAIATVSPWHVGLSVVQSFWAGVPVVTRPGSRHAPEFEYCVENENTLFYRGGSSELARVMARLLNSELREEMARNARKYYIEKLDIENMVQGFEAAISFCEERRILRPNI